MQPCVDFPAYTLPQCSFVLVFISHLQPASMQPCDDFPAYSLPQCSLMLISIPLIYLNAAAWLILIPAVCLNAASWLPHTNISYKECSVKGYKGTRDVPSLPHSPAHLLSSHKHMSISPMHPLVPLKLENSTLYKCMSLLSLIHAAFPYSPIHLAIFSPPPSPSATIESISDSQTLEECMLSSLMLTCSHITDLYLPLCTFSFSS
jgi:hypothetical protein